MSTDIATRRGCSVAILVCFGTPGPDSDGDPARIVTDCRWFAPSREEDMSAKLSVEEVLTHLETQMAYHKQKEEHHAGQEVFHREQKGAHAAEYETIAHHYEAFKATAGTAVDLAVRTGMLPRSSVRDLPPGRPVRRSHLVARLVAELPAGATFQASTLAAEVNRRFREALRKPADARLVSAALRRLAAKGVIRLVERGAAHREARYTKG
jgi:hypothetical protein